MIEHTTDCECSSGGWCPRHKVNKTDHFAKLCAENEAYFALWEAGSGPSIHGTLEDGVPLAIPRKSKGLGDVVAKVVRAVGLKRPKQDCGCEQRRSWLNRVLPFNRD